ncbi:hypothetical protein OHA72_43310 [Dactylosporangium sp. NBC_01737]|uniref:hypothetical protein n=1 Tax=Dactylosporangium sp. NBC_01737 TaxID=2975959 RepID=UPI002E107177|nr:hypothetical protein OHA72_43310 [Dactylosporangium sp. NBC_01737]
MANVVRERLHGEELEVRSGLKHFTGATLVWVSRPWNGDGGERLWVVGPARRSSPRRWLWVPDPPPMELDVDGTTVYLAHFNHRRARYSALEPPTEP